MTVQQSASEQAQAKTKLTALLDAVHALDPKLFTATSWQAVATASDTAAQLVKDDTASTDALTKAYTDLQKALQQLEADRGVTQAQLKGLINAAEALKSDAYTADSFAKLQAAVAAAKPVNADEHATQVQIQSAIQAITAAWVALELKPQPTPVTDLAQWLQVAAALKADDYTPASYAKLTDAITAGKKVAADPNASTAAQQAAVDQLRPRLTRLCHAPTNSCWRRSLQRPTS